MEQVTFTRDELVEAVGSRIVGAMLEMFESQGGAPEDLADAILEALARR